MTREDGDFSPLRGERRGNPSGMGRQSTRHLHNCNQNG
jgi:hypothetical protein